MPWKTLITVTPIAILLAIALLKGINGAVLASGLSLIAGMGGFAIGRASKS